uniref:Uncharacterized protein n=1 Tax=Panagrolaimus sp. PS1159 TaxID=55785 RepID=A0AC35GMK2_9BILA
MDNQQTLRPHFQNELDLLKNEIDKLKKLNDDQKDMIYDQAMTVSRNKKITELNTTIKNHEKVKYNFRSKITELEENYKATLERKMEPKNREINKVKEKMADEIKKCKSNPVSVIQEQSVPIFPTHAKRGRPRKITKRGGHPPKAILPTPPSSNENVAPTATVSFKRGRPKKVIPLPSIKNKENEPSEKSPGKRGRQKKCVVFFSP